MESVLISIQPKWCELIASGKKTIEVRKTRPKIDTPFKVYIYQTKTIYVSKSKENDILDPAKHSGKVIGEFICDRIVDCREIGGKDFYEMSQMTYEEWRKYTDNFKGNVYSWFILSPKIYDKPKELSEFKKINRECWYADLGLAKRDCLECQNKECFVQRPPQSWCHVEET